VSRYYLTDFNADTPSYQDILSMVQEAHNALRIHEKVPATIDGLQRVDCALRTFLSQIALRLRLETDKYESVYDEYLRNREAMHERDIGQLELPILE
jgi:hypothetical protein